MSTRRFVAMGCTVEVGGATADELAAVELLFRGRDRQFSRFREGSELNRVNRAPTDEAVQRLRELESAGVTRVMLQHLDHEDLETVEWIGRELAPAAA